MVVGQVYAAGPRPNRGDVVVGAPSTYTLAANWITGVSQDSGTKGQSLKLGDGDDFSFYAFAGWWDHKLSDVRKIRASFLPGTGTVNSGGSPRFSLEVANADKTPFNVGYPVAIFLDPASCSNAALGGWSEADFTSNVTNCAISDNVGHYYTSDGVVSAWSKLVADPYYAGKRVWLMYLIQDASVGQNYVDRIMLDNAFFTKKP
jgi:hypothetical protein